jgi:hypothetical protein
MNNRVLSVGVERAPGVLGLFLMLVVAKLASQGYAVKHTVAGQVWAFLARRVIDGIAVIGWLADRLLPPSANGGI